MTQFQPTAISIGQLHFLRTQFGNWKVQSHGFNYNMKARNCTSRDSVWRCSRYPNCRVTLRTHNARECSADVGGTPGR